MSPRRRLALRFGAFIAITAVGTWLWLEGGRGDYRRFLMDVMRPMLGWLGVPNMRLGLLPHRFMSFVPFVALMLVTPDLSSSRRWWGTAIGCFVLFLSHVGFVAASVAAYSAYGSTPRAVQALFPVMLLVDSMPFIVWFVIAREVILGWVSKVTARVFADKR